PEKKFEWINPSRRERRREQQTYSVDDYYKDIIGNSKSKEKAAVQSKVPKAPKFIHGQDFQFFPKELEALQEKEQLYYKKKVNYKVSAYDVGATGSDDEYDSQADDQSDTKSVKEKIKELKEKIENAPEFTEEDEREKQRLLSESFTNWNKREFFAFISACTKYGTDNIEVIKKSIDTKTPEEVEAYFTVFWKRYSEINGYEKYLANIEAGMKKNERLKLQEILVKKKVEQYQYPLHQMVIQYPPNNARRTYNSLEDKFILTIINKYGLFDEKLCEKLKQEIMVSKLFTFDWFIKSRSLHELSKRVNTLLSLITREHEAPETLKKKRKQPSGREETPSSQTATPFVGQSLNENGINHNKKVKVTPE
ncbi:hypothetical protein Kpol_1010p9, partial [Vanderwaltozyma polyspora DSM 70294]